MGATEEVKRASRGGQGARQWDLKASQTLLRVNQRGQKTIQWTLGGSHWGHWQKMTKDVRETGHHCSS